MKQTSTLEEYTARWKKFEAAFDRHPIAQEIRRLKLETAELDAELESLGKVSSASLRRPTSSHPEDQLFSLDQ